MILGMFNRSKVLEKAMDASWLRNEAIAQNMANVNTPGYKRKTVAFESLLQQAMEDKDFDSSKADDIAINITQDNKSLSMRLDGNNVDVENETADTAKNFMKYSVLQQSLNAQYRLLRSAIKEGRG